MTPQGMCNLREYLRKTYSDGRYTNCVTDWVSCTSHFQLINLVGVNVYFFDSESLH